MVHEGHFLPEIDKMGHFFPEQNVRAHLKFIYPCGRLYVDQVPPLQGNK